MAKQKKTTKTIVEPILDLTAPALPDEQTLPSAGLGDVVKKITNALGIETCTKCEERRKTLNRMFPWLRANEMEPLSGEDLELMLRIRKTPSAVQNDDVDALFKLYNRIYSPQRPIKRCQCSGLLRTIVERLELLITQD